jgi:hypothetical protein
MWKAFLNLLCRAALGTVEAKGTTPIAVAMGLLTTVVETSLLVWKHRLPNQGLGAALTAQLRAWQASIGLGLAVSFAAWSVFFIYRAARIVYDERVSMRTTIAVLSKPQREGPDFRPAIVNVGVFPAGDKTNSNVLIVGTIYNRGASGNLNDVSIEATFNDGRRVTAQIANPFDPAQVPNVRLGKNNQGQWMELPGAMYWLNQKSKMIPSFGRLDGFAMGLLRGVTKDEVEAERPTFVLTCSDVADREAAATYKWGSGTPAAAGIALRDLQRPLGDQ